MECSRSDIVAPACHLIPEESVETSSVVDMELQFCDNPAKVCIFKSFPELQEEEVYLTEKLEQEHAIAAAGSLLRHLSFKGRVAS